MVDIFATFGPACSDAETIHKMFEMGMSGIRFNLSHMMLSDHADDIEMIKKTAADNGIDPKILIDLRGPELRIGDVDGSMLLNEGESVLLSGSTSKYKSPKATVIGAENTITEDHGMDEGTKVIRLSPQITEMISPGQDILIDDGKILLKAEKINGRKIMARVIRGGEITSRKSILPIGSEDMLPTLTDADITNIASAAGMGITGVMQPFVRGKEDVMNVRKALDEAGGSDIKIYAKIENQKGVEKLDEIISCADEIIIARGDLGNSLPLWELPALQKKISAACVKAKRPFMVVTQMLSSMEHSAVPTRAEVSDIYNAVLDGASSVMVTGETAVGEYPAEVIKYLYKTAESAL